MCTAQPRRALRRTLKNPKQRFLRSVFQLSAFTFLALGTAQATEFIVDQHNPKASDENLGTREKPLRTIQAAATRVKAGDKVTIHAGEYRETVIIKASGNPEAPIVIEAAPNETVVIKGSDVIKGWVRTSPNVWKAKLPPVPPRAG